MLLKSRDDYFGTSLNTGLSDVSSPHVYIQVMCFCSSVPPSLCIWKPNIRSSLLLAYLFITRLRWCEPHPGCTSFLLLHLAMMYMPISDQSYNTCLAATGNSLWFIYNQMVNFLILSHRHFKDAFMYSKLLLYVNYSKLQNSTLKEKMIYFFFSKHKWNKMKSET
jgi:hypothetical protein